MMFWSIVFVEGEEEAESIKKSQAQRPHKKSLKRSIEMTMTESPIIANERVDGRCLKQRRSEFDVASPVRLTNQCSASAKQTELSMSQERYKPPPPPLPSSSSQLERPKQLVHAQHNSDDLQPTDMLDPNTKPDIKLPVEWMLVWSNSKKRWYYFDKKNNASFWEWPPCVESVTATRQS
jgi:hypothetical protein